MTPVTQIAALKSYPFKRLDKSVVAALRKHADIEVQGTIARRANTLIRLFECFCDITNTDISYTYLSSSSFIKIVEEFIGALSSGELVDLPRQNTYQLIRVLALTLESLKSDIPSLLVHKWSPDLPDRFSHRWEAKKRFLDTEACLYWSGWMATSRESKDIHLRIPLLWYSHGKDFACMVFDAYKRHFEKQARPLLTIPNTFISYLAEDPTKWPAETFLDPLRIEDFFKEFMRDHFFDCHKRGLNINSKLKEWGTFINNIHQAFIDTGLWAAPFSLSLPKPYIRPGVSGAKTHVKISEDGAQVQTKLITEVPLQYTDEQAIELLFNDVRKDVSIVHAWAEYFTRDLYQRSVRRLELAKDGVCQTGKNSERSLNEIGLNNLCATFESIDYCDLVDQKNTQVKLFGFEQKYTLAQLLGLPTVNTLYPFMLLLAYEHPEITPTFLTQFTLYDKAGRLVGFTKSGEGYQLMGYKRRRGKHLAQQKIQLTNKATNLVKQIIEITAPLRSYCRKIDDDNWRYLFLTCGRGFGKPRIAKVPSWSTSTISSQRSVRSAKDKFIDVLKEFDKPHAEEDAIRFMRRVSLSTLRASRAVEIYLETQSVDAMAKALGHKNYSTALLSNYLPEPILAFFQTRWIRIFQKAFICEAMKSSPHLLRAASFETMEDLHQFLSNHRLRDIPRHLSNPSNESSQVDSNDGHVLISIDAGILTALLSLEKAVELSPTPKQVNGLARYWSQVSQLISNEINKGADPLLQEHLDTARLHADPNRMMRMIHAAPS